jgi:acyl-CoA synthetase (AMP-forming)/AMP-acid ligase II
MEFNLADLFENAVDAFADRECIVAEGQRRTYAEMDARANQLAHHLASNGIGPGAHVGIYAYNSVEWVESLWAVFKLRAIWININFRYVEDELRYLFDNAALDALVYQRQFAPRVAAVRDGLPKLRHTVAIEDASGADTAKLDSAEYEAALAGESTDRDFAPRSGDDHYMLYTGGTTGMPKGVVWRHEDVFFALGGGIDQVDGTRIERGEEMVAKGLGVPQSVFLPIAPLMHGATQWSVMAGSLVGRKNVLVAKFDPDEVWQLVGEETVDGVMITGDAMGRPLVEALHSDSSKYDLSSLGMIVSSAAVFSPTVKDEFFEHLPNLVITDSIGSSESGGNGVAIITKGNTAMKGGGPTVRAGANAHVLDENLDPVTPGSGVIGKLARSGNIPIGYFGDPAKTAETFVEKNGERYSMPGDFAMLEADGTITLLGRGSVSINSGGEKIFPEEVESAIKSHPDAFDAIVVGVPDERWGSRVSAVVQLRPGAGLVLENLQEHCRQKLAGYKVPRELHLVDQIVRSPTGKPDYPWAKRVAMGEAGN